MAETPHFDAIIIGAGFSGMYMLKKLRDELGLNVRVYEAAETVGGTWYWNRYPGARCDSDAYVYCFTWDKPLLQEWEWGAIPRATGNPSLLGACGRTARPQAQHSVQHQDCRGRV